MILIDPRGGSCDLEAPLTKIGLPVTMDDQFAAGDLTFIGRGDGGSSVAIGIEYKQLGECIASMRSGRLAVQAERMQQAYEFNWLLLVGEMLYDKRGLLLKRTGRHETRPLPGNMTANEFWKRLFVLHLKRGLVPLLVTTERHAVKIIETLYRTWTDQDADEHSSHLAIYRAPSVMPLPDEVETLRTFPGVGIKVALAANEVFSGSIRRAVNADVDEWANLSTMDKKGHERRFGHKAALDVKEYLG